MIKTVIFSMILPVLAGGGLVALCWLLPPFRKWRWLSSACFGLALAVGVFASFVAENGVPPFPPAERAQWVGSIDLQAIGSALERTGLAAVTELVGSGHLTSLHTLCLRDASWISKQLLLALLRAVRPRAHAWCTPTPCPTPPSVHC